MASLTPELATEVRDLILNSPADSPYDALKQQLIRRTTVSEQRKLQQLFNTEDLGDHKPSQLLTEDLGDRKPSQLLRRLQQLLEDRASTFDASFLRELFLQHLPNHVRMVLASTADTVSIDHLADLADKIIEVALPSNPVSAVQSSFPLQSEMDHLRSEVTRLQERVQLLSFSKRCQAHRSPTPAPDPAGICWYNQKYGESARKCRSPCSFSPNAEATH